jgi:hypothetical protein
MQQDQSDEPKPPVAWKKSNKRGVRGGRGLGAKSRKAAELLDAPVEKVGRALEVGDPEPHWEAQRRPPRMTDFRLEVQALSEGWLDSAPVEARQAVTNTVLKMVVDEKSPENVKLKASALFLRIYALIQKAKTDAAVIHARAIDMGEGVTPVFEQPKQDDKLGAEEAVYQMIRKAKSVEEVESIQRLAIETGLIKDD